MYDYTEQIKKYLETEQKVISSLVLEQISDVMNVLERARIAGKRIFVCGNGGSASTASHFECDFNKGISYGQKMKYDLECLNDNITMMMAIANDIGYDEIFITALKNKMKSGDVVIGISGSGNSENVCKALEYANEIDAISVALVGYDGGHLKEIAKHYIHVEIDNMQIVEDMHLIMDHLMMYILSGMPDN